MKIDHVAIWVKDLEGMRAFYEKFFHAVAGRKYQNPAKQFESYFLRFDYGARVELMKKTGIPENPLKPGEQHMGYSHLALSVSKVEDVDRMAQVMKNAGYQVLDGPRRTGDGYYECVILDPEDNRIEIAAQP